METFKILLKPIIVILMMVRLFLSNPTLFNKTLIEIEDLVLKAFESDKVTKATKKIKGK